MFTEREYYLICWIIITIYSGDKTILKADKDLHVRVEPKSRRSGTCVRRHA